MITDTQKITISGREVSVPSKAAIREILSAHASVLSDVNVEQIQRYSALLLLWNEKLNLTAIDNPTEIISRHFGDSMLGLPCLPEKGRLADVGSGAGFPGLALKIFRPEVEVLLIEQNTKKSAFLNEAIRAVGLTGATVQRGNYLDLPASLPKFDRIAARALGDYRQLLGWARGRLNSTGQIVLWLGSDDSVRLSRLTDWDWQPPLRMAESRRRELLIGSPR
jgi:16S rRNA (guanine527-N7)-methyltransferase